MEVISSSVIGDIVRDAIEPCFQDDWLLIDKNFLQTLSIELPRILDRFIDALTIMLPEGNDSKSKFVTAMLSLNNHITTLKGGATAAANRDVR